MKQAAILCALLAASAASAKLPDTAKGEDGKRRPPAIVEDHLRGFIGAWREPGEMLMRAKLAGDTAAVSALTAYRDAGLAFCIVGFYVDDFTTINSGTFVANGMAGDCTDHGIMLARSRQLVDAGKIRLSPRDHQPIEVILVFPASCASDWIYEITRTARGGE